MRRPPYARRRSSKQILVETQDVLADPELQDICLQLDPLNSGGQNIICHFLDVTVHSDQVQRKVEQHVALTSGQVITAEQVRQTLRGEPSSFPSVADARAAFTRDYLVRLLKLTDGNVCDAARMAQRNRSEFYKLLS